MRSLLVLPLVSLSAACTQTAASRLATADVSAHRKCAASAWSVEGDQAGARLGASVAFADVNGDGYDDAVVGVPMYTDTLAAQGLVEVYDGGPCGLSSTPSWSFLGFAAHDWAGSDVASAGDTNGDGYEDVIVGEPGWDGGFADQGLALLFLGSPTGLASRWSWATVPNQAGAYFGLTVEGTGDLDADGLDDFVVGAPLYSNFLAQEGMICAWLGSATTVLDRPTNCAYGNITAARLGMDVSPAGDVNGDGYADLVAGGDGSGTSPGMARIYAGNADGFSNLPVANLGRGWAWYGLTTTGVGDLNGDGYDEVAVSQSWDDPATTADRQLVDIYYGAAAGPLTTPGTTLEAMHPDMGFGHWVGAAGDVDGDGYGDLAVSEPLANGGAAGEGAVFAYRGDALGLEAGPSWKHYAGHPGDGLGLWGAGAGDTDGDGAPELLVGAQTASYGELNEGRAVLLVPSF